MAVREDTKRSLQSFSLIKRALENSGTLTNPKDEADLRTSIKVFLSNVPKVAREEGPDRESERTVAFSGNLYEKLSAEKGREPVGPSLESALL